MEMLSNIKKNLIIRQYKTALLLLKFYSNGKGLVLILREFQNQNQTPSLIRSNSRFWEKSCKTILKSFQDLKRHILKDLARKSQQINAFVNILNAFSSPSISFPYYICPTNLGLRYNNFITCMEHQANPSTQPSPSKRSLLYFEPQIIKSMIVLEIKTQAKDLYTYQLGVIASNKSIIFSSQINIYKIHKYYVFRQIWIKIYYICFQLSKEKHLSEIECQSKDISHVDQLKGLNMLYFKENILPMPSKRIFSQEESNICAGFIARIETDQKGSLLLKICTFYGRPQQAASKYPSGLIYIRLGGQCVFYGFCQVKKKVQLNYDMSFRRPRNVQCICESRVKSGSTLIVDDDLKMKQVDKLMEFPYNSIGLLRSPSDAYGNIHFGTASVLLNSDGMTSKFLITCAHNFIDFKVKPDTQKLAKMQYKGQKLVLVKKESDNTKNYIQLFQKCDQLSIKTVHIPPKLIKYLTNPSDDLKCGFECIDNKKHDIFLHQMYDIAIVELTENINVLSGFRLKQTAKKGYFSKLDKIEIAGFPTALTRQKKSTIQFGRMYHQSVEDHQSNNRQKCFCISTIKLGQEQGHKFIQHKLSTLPGNSGSPIFEKISPRQSYLLGVHTQGIGADRIPNNIKIDNQTEYVLGTLNKGVYIYDQQVFNWIKSIQGIQQVIDKNIRD